MTIFSGDSSSEKGSSFSVGTIFGLVTKYWYLFLLSIIIALGGAYIYLRYTTPIYQTTATLLIKEQPKNMSDEILKEGSSAQSAVSIENEIELLKALSTIEKAVDDLGLTVGYFREKSFGNDQDIYTKSPINLRPISVTDKAYQSPLFITVLDKQHYELQQGESDQKSQHLFGETVNNDAGSYKVFLSDSIKPIDTNPVKIRLFQREKIARSYKSTLKVALINQSSTVLKLTLEDALPERGKLVMGKIIDSYRFSTLADKNLEAKNTIQFIDERLRLITGELNGVEQHVESYKRAKNVTDLGQEGQLVLNNANVNDAKMAEVSMQLTMLDGMENYLKNSQNNAAPAAPNDPVLTELLHKLSEQQTQREKYARSMQTDNPFMKELAGQIADTKKLIQENVVNQRHNLEITQTKLKQLGGQFSSAIQTIPRKERELITIKRQQSIKENLYLLLLQKKEETALKYAAAVTDSRVVDQPTSASYPLKPNPKNIYLVAFLAGLLVPFGGLSARGLLSNTVKNRHEIEEETGVTVFGEIMQTPKATKKTNLAPLMDQLVAEQFKIVRANLASSFDVDASTLGKTILVTSSTVGEGKSFFSTNMALTLAQLDKRVVVLELDLRSPKTTEYMGITNGKEYGLSDYLTGQRSMSEVIRQTVLSPNLFLISSGPTPANPAELLSGSRIATLISALRHEFDYIVLDTPPVAFVADTLVLGQYADTSFYIVRQSYTPRNYMQLLSTIESSQKFKSLQVIFNGVQPAHSKEMLHRYKYAYSTN